jgi:hypothetical protein
VWKIAGGKALLRTHPQGLQVIGPGRDEVIPTPPGFEQGFGKVVSDCLEAFDRGDPPPITAADCAAAVNLIFASYARANSIR